MTASPRDLATVQDEFLALLARRELTAVNRILRLYAPVYRDLVKQAEALAIELADAQARGIDLTALSARNQRIVALRDQIAARIDTFARQAEISTRDLQGIGVDLGLSHSSTLMGTALAASAPGFQTSFTRLPAQALDNLVGQFADGSPLRSLFQTFGPDAATAAEQILFKTLAQGQHPTVAARALRTQLGVPATRAMAISRTELLRSYRTSALETFRQNQDVVIGWRWVAHIGPRTCSSCLAQHNTVHPLSESMASHTNCRCSQSPVTRSWSSLGFPPEIEALAPPDLPTQRPGPALFDRFSAADQRKVLGDRKYAMFKRGEIDLVDTVQHTSHPRWGIGTQEASVAASLANHNQPKPWLRYEPPSVPPVPLRVITDREGALQVAQRLLRRDPGQGYRDLVIRLVQRFGAVLTPAEVRQLRDRLRRSA